MTIWLMLHWSTLPKRSSFLFLRWAFACVRYIKFQTNIAVQAFSLTRKSRINSVISSCRTCQKTGIRGWFILLQNGKTTEIYMIDLWTWSYPHILWNTRQSSFKSIKSSWWTSSVYCKLFYSNIPPPRHVNLVLNHEFWKLAIFLVPDLLSPCISGSRSEWHPFGKDYSAVKRLETLVLSKAFDTSENSGKLLLYHSQQRIIGFHPSMCSISSLTGIVYGLVFPRTKGRAASNIPLSIPFMEGGKYIPCDARNNGKTGTTRASDDSAL